MHLALGFYLSAFILSFLLICVPPYLFLSFPFLFSLFPPDLRFEEEC